MVGSGSKVNLQVMRQIFDLFITLVSILYFKKIKAEIVLYVFRELDEERVRLAQRA